MARESWHQIMMDHAHAAAKRSRCVRHQVGAVICTQEFRILSTGYNGPPATMPTPDDAACDAFCPRAETTTPQPHYLDCVAIHAEANALLFVDRSLCEGARLYCTGPICWECSKLISNSGITCVRFVPDANVSHRNEDAGITLMKHCGIKVKPWMV